MNPLSVSVCHQNAIDQLETLSLETYEVYLRTATLKDLHLSIKRFKEVLDLTPDDHPGRASRLKSLAVGYGLQYRWTGALDDLELSIQRLQESVDLTPDDHPDLADRLQNLGAGYINRYRRTGAPDDLEFAIQRLQDAFNLTPEDHTDRADRLQNLGVGYSDQYRRTGALDDLELSIQRFREAVDLTPEDHPDRAGRLLNLGVGYIDRYRRTGALNDLELAIRKFREAIDLTPEDYPDRADQLLNLGVGYSDRYRRTGALDDLELSIQHFREAVNLTPEDHTDRAGRLQNLGVGYGDRYQRTGALNDLEFSIQRKQEAINLTPDNHRDRASRLLSLEVGYRERYQRTGALNDLEFSIQRLQESVDLTPDDHPDRADRLQNLGARYIDRYRRTGALDNLELAIQRGKEAVDFTPDDHPDRAGRLQNLGVGYRERYLQTGALNDLELSIQRFREAIDITPDNHPDRAGRLQNLGVGYIDRYQRTGTLGDLDLPIQQLQEAIDLTPEDHPDRAGRLLNLGVGYREQYQLTGALGDLEICIQRFQEALNHEPSPPVIRLRAGRQLFKAYAALKNWPSACDVASLAISLIPLLTSRSLERSDMQHQVNEIVGLASDATATALMVGKPVHEAMQLLEVGRGIITSSLADIRTDVTDLKEKFPDFATQFNSLRDLLDSPKELRKDSRRYNTGKRLDELIQEIRTLSGFHRFLLGPSEDEFRRAAACGPIVVVNLSDYGCHALIIEQKQLRALELSFLDTKNLQIQADKLASPDIEMLGWLWDKIASPVLNAINFVQSPKHTWPRVWWVLTGPLARFPIHAAGHYTDGRIHDTVMDRIVSSYSSSVKTIINARRKPSMPTNSIKEESMVLVGMAQTPEYSSLQFAPKEIEMLAELGTSMQLKVKQPLSCRKETLSAMKGCKIFHFAGHGYTDLPDPSKSALVLNDGKLTVENIFDINLHRHKPFLAYLSACGTGQVKHDGLIDEGLHLIGAYQLAGFRHVIGTLWEVNDESCIDVAKSTYQWMQKHDLSDRSVSEGLHHACRELRSQWVEKNYVREALRRGTKSEGKAGVTPVQEQSRSAQFEVRDLRDIESVEDLPLHWVPYVHFGI